MTKRLEVFGTMRADFIVCEIGSDARGFLDNKERFISEASSFRTSETFSKGTARLYFQLNHTL
jgi:hypothetical protein